MPNSSPPPHLLPAQLHTLGKRWQHILILLLSVLTLSHAALANDDRTRTGNTTPLNVVTSFSILADLVEQVGGPYVKVSSLIGPGEDAHAYQSRPSDARLVQAADLVVSNGLGFDHWLERLAATAGKQHHLLIASEGIAALKADHAHHDHGGQAHHHHGELDPHAWQDVANVKVYVDNIAAALIRRLPDEADAIEARRTAYQHTLNALDEEIRSRLATIPAEARLVVSSHEAFNYFGRAYGVRFMAASGVSHDAEASAAGIARLIRQIRREQVAVVFLENVSDSRLIERIGKESGARVGGTLISDALSPADGPAPDYPSMMRHNLRVLLEGLQGER